MFSNTYKGVCKKSGLASEALTRVKEQLEQNGPFLQIPYNNCVILVYSSFSTLKIAGDMNRNVKKWIVTKWTDYRFSYVKMVSLSTQKHSPKIRLTETYHISNQQKFYDDSNGLIGFEIAPLHEEGNLILARPLFCKSHYTMVNNKKVDSIKLDYLIHT